MGMVKCPVHGLTHFTCSCVHVQDAVDSHRFERARVVADTRGDVYSLCQRCVDLARQPEGPGKELSCGGVVALGGTTITGYCHECTREWFAATEQGDFSDAIACARLADRI
jgi:hypothetical protein